MTIVEARPFTGIGDLNGLSQGAFALVLKQVGRAGEDNDLAAAAILQTAQRQTVCIGMRHHFVNLSHHKFIRLPRKTAELGVADLAP